MLAMDYPHDLNRFVQAQEEDYAAALREVSAGRKQTHWMWYILPQFRGLGSSSMAQRYAIQSRAEAEAYLAHPVLGERLREMVQATLQVEGRSATAIFGQPDDLKLKSCATLFAAISPTGSEFHKLLEKYFGGQEDKRTLALLAEGASLS